MWKLYFAKGAFFAALAVILGAFAAHGLKKHLETGELDLQSLQNFETGARYQMYHAIAIIITALLMKMTSENRLLKIAGWLFAVGILFFSGSLYLLSTRNLLGIESWRWLGPITPLGGLCFISGWLLLALGVLQKEKANAA
jgi:uncharacterized membrane protein YgdD (TMEM256/DUF423 family)